MVVLTAWSALLFAFTRQAAPSQVEMVDLGLSVDWASFNIGATSPEQAGSYFAWGEVKTKQVYDWPTYQYGKEPNKLTKYCPYPEWGLNQYTDTLLVLESSDDAATINWGKDYRTPNMYEWLELMHHCTWTWVNNYNNTKVAGYQVTSKKNGNSIFLPTTGYKYQQGIDCPTTDGYYWTATVDDADPNNAWVVNFYKEGTVSQYLRNSLYRDCGRAVRAVSAIAKPFDEDGKELQQAIDDTPAGGTFVLQKDYTLGPQTPEGVFITKPITIDLNGHTINGNGLVRCLFISTENVEDEIIIEDNSTTGNGFITGGFSQFGGGIYAASGHVILNSGHLNYNATDGLHWGGGGIYVDIDAALTMYGGEISYNKTEYAGGGGIAAIGQFDMFGGTIAGNYTYGRGGGIRVEGPTSIFAGDIKDNTGLYGGGIFVFGESGFVGHTVALNLTAQMGDSIVITGNIATGAEGGVTGESRICLSGKIICKDNICNTMGFKVLKNFWTYVPIFVVGDLTGSNIYFGAADGVTDKPTCRIFAYNYSQYHQDDFNNYFHFEGNAPMSAILNDNGHIEVVTGSGVENIDAASPAHVSKILQQGQLLIIYGNKKYNAIGQEL